VNKTDAIKKAREYADASCRSGKDRIDCNGCIDDLAKLIEEVHAAGKREGIEAAAKVAKATADDFWRAAFRNPDTPWVQLERAFGVDEAERNIRALLQTEARAETGEGKSGVCGEKMGKKPEWMSEWQYDHCSCKRRAGHDGPHACEHENAEMLRDHEKGGGT
jgi:hypothetical protein